MINCNVKQFDSKMDDKTENKVAGFSTSTNKAAKQDQQIIVGTIVLQ